MFHRNSFEKEIPSGGSQAGIISQSCSLTRPWPLKARAALTEDSATESVRDKSGEFIESVKSKDFDKINYPRLGNWKCKRQIRGFQSASQHPPADSMVDDDDDDDEYYYYYY